MKVLKLLRCFWKHPITRHEFEAVNYYVQYERDNPEGYAKFNTYGGHKFLINHEDDIDKEIINSLSAEILKFPGIDQFLINTHETLLYNEKQSAIFSNLAFGYNFQNLILNTQTDNIARLHTRILFHDIRNIDYQNIIFPAIPLALNLNRSGKVDSLYPAEYMDQQKVNQILERDNGLSFE